MYATTDELIAAVRTEGRIPDNVPDYPDTKILALADAVISKYMVPALASLRQGYLVARYETSVVAGQSSYRVPPRAAGDALETVCLVNTDGSESYLTHVELSEQGRFSLARSSPGAFCIQGTDVVLLPPPDGTSPTLRVRYTQRRAKLVPVSSCVLITDVSSPPTTPTLEGNTQPFTTQTVFDVIRPLPPFATVAEDMPINSYSVPPAPFNFLFTQMTAAQNAAIDVGDYLCVAGETCVVQLPVELHSPLAELTAASILRQMGYDQQAQTARAEGMAGVSSFALLAAPRVKDQLVKVVNRGSVLRMRGRGRYGH